MTKDKLIEQIIDGNKKMTKVMIGVEGALEKINDQNVLHSSLFTKTVNDNTNALKLLCEKNKAADWTIKVILILLTAAVIILAGAEKALKLFPMIK